MANKKSFILFKDSLDILPEMTDDQAGKLFKAIRAYQNGEELELDIVTKMLMISFKNQFVRDEQKYNVIVERNQNNGSKSNGRPPKKKKTEIIPQLPIITQENPVGLNGNKNNPNNLVSDTGTDTVIENGSSIIKPEIELPASPEKLVFSLKDFKDYFETAIQWRDQICMKTKLDQSSLKIQFDEFIADNTLKQVVFPNRGKAIPHFINWLNIQLKFNKNVSKQQIDTIEEAKRLSRENGGKN